MFSTKNWIAENYVQAECQRIYAWSYISSDGTLSWLWHDKPVQECRFYSVTVDEM